MKFCPGRFDVTCEFQPRVKGIFFYFISPQDEILLQRFAAYFTKMFYGKSMYCMQLQYYTKTMILDFVNKRSKMFDFKTLKIVYWLQLIQ